MRLHSTARVKNSRFGPYSGPTPATDHQTPAPGTPAPGTRPPAPGTPPDTGPPAPGTSEAHGDAEHGSLWSGLFWPTLNFIILAGGLWWFFKAPLSAYLRDRHHTIRSELVEAANARNAAAAQLAEIDWKLQALPGEIEALRTRGAEEIAAEEKRIAALATAERERLLEQTRREIEVRVRLARRELVEHAANLSVQLAGERLREELTPTEQDRLVNRYLEHVSDRHA